MHIDIEFVSDKDRLDIYADFGATEESVRRDAKYLMKWLEQQPHLPNIKDEEFLANFLIRCKNSLEKAKNRLHLYYVCRATFSRIFKNRSESEKEILRCWDVVQLLPLPKLNPDRRRIIIHSLSPLVDKIPVTPEVITQLYSIIMDVGLKSDTCRGYIIVYDFTHLTFTFSSTLVSTWKSGLQLLQEGAPIQVYKIYVLNLLPAFQHLINIGLSLIPKKLANRVVIWPKSSTELIEELPKSVLPSNYGGDELSVAELKEGITNLIDDYREWFVSTENDKADLSKIPKDYGFENLDSMYGLSGSFRKISFD